MANKSKAKHTETVNPYTFIPLRGYKNVNKFKVLPDTNGSVDNVEPLFWGKFQCDLTTRTELSIPDASRSITYNDPEKKGMKSYPFFVVDNRPVIPGSSLRGVIRSIYEIISNSCVHANDARFHAQSSRKKAGLLEYKNGVYRLYEAQRFPVFEDQTFSSKEKIDSLVNGQEVFFSNKTVNSRKIAFIAPEGQKGYFLRVNIFKNENSETGGPSHPSIFQRNGSSSSIIDPVFIDCLDENIDLYDLAEKPDIETGKRAQGKSGKDYRECFEKMKQGEGFLPVWFLKTSVKIGESTKVFYEFAPSQMSRSVYVERVSDFLDKVGLNACQIPENCCPACNLFGMVSTDNKGAKSSRVRFSDAVLLGENPSMRKVIFPAMMGPRISSFEFYLYNTDKDKKFSFDLRDDNTRLSGRKMYWHHPDGLAGYSPEIDPDRPDLQAEFEVLSKGSTFTFEVYFDGVSKTELNQLAYALTLGEYLGSDGKDYCHKIGHGKPLGLGSVSVSLKEGLIRSFDGAQYSVVADCGWKLDRDSVEKGLSSVAALKAVADFAAVSSGKTIDYPRNDAGEIFGWFADNRDTFDGGGSRKYVEVIMRAVPGYSFNEDFGNELSQYNEKKRVEKKSESKETDSRWGALGALKLGK